MTPLEAHHWLNLTVYDTFPLQVPPIVTDLLSDRLRDYQFAMLAEVARMMRLGYRRVLLQCPTGGGKTVCAESAISSALQQEQFAQFLVHRRELIKQTSATFTGAGLPHSFVATGFPFDPAAALLLAGVQTLVSRTDLLLPPNLIVVDESHHAVSATYARILDRFPDAYVLGLTATPERLDGRGLNEQYDVMVLGPPVWWLIQEGHLSPYRYFAAATAESVQADAAKAGYREQAVAEIVDRPEIVGDVVEHYLRLAPGEQGIVFGHSVEHSRKLADAFRANGVPAMHIDGTSSDDERDYFDDAFRAGDIRIGCNQAIFAEGYDVPNISYLADAAPSKSLITVAQRRGRALRPGAGKVAIMCDHAGNVFRHGMPDDEREWTLEGRTARERAERAAAAEANSVHQCLSCYRVVPSVVRVCPGCGTEFPVQERKVKLTPGELAELKRVAMVKRKTEERQCKTYEDFRALARDRGYQHPHGWAKRQIELRRRGRITTR